MESNMLSSQLIHNRRAYKNNGYHQSIPLTATSSSNVVNLFNSNTSTTNTKKVKTDNLKGSLLSFKMSQAENFDKRQNIVKRPIITPQNKQSLNS